MGLLAVSLLAANGVRPLRCFEPSEFRRELARRCGATHVAGPQRLDLAGWREATGVDDGPSIVFEAAGHLLVEAVVLATDFGAVVQLGYNTGAVVSLRPHVLVDKQVRVIGVQGNEFTMQEAIDVLERGLVDPDAVVTDEVAFDDFDASLARLRSASAGKILLTPG
jgi:threonine 3-dehydrogenase